MEQKDILIVEDDKAITRVLELEFQYEGLTFDIAYNGLEGFEYFEANRYKVILLDLMLPVMNGIELCRKIRRNSNVQIIMLTAKRDMTDKVVGLDMGADDYITKPFEMEELLARVRASMRRTRMDQAAFVNLTVGPLEINTLTREVTLSGNRIDLTKKEYELLEYLTQNTGIVLTRDQIINHVWGYDFVGDTNVLDVYIKYLRNKIDYPYKVKLIQTVRGIGYTLKE